jgi:hypothetical protein
MIGCYFNSVFITKKTQKQHQNIQRAFSHILIMFIEYIAKIKYLALIFIKNSLFHISGWCRPKVCIQLKIHTLSRYRMIKS